MIATFFSAPRAKQLAPRLIRVQRLPAWEPTPAFGLAGARYTAK
jgi:hypothetical protein